MTKWKMKGQYTKTCSCLATCPCDTIGVPAPHKYCEGMAGMHIQEGNFGKIKLNGLNWVGVYHWPGALHEGNGTMQVFIDKKATKEQREALLQILSGKAGGTMFEILASVVSKALEPKFVPITFTFDKEKRKANVSIRGFLDVKIEPLVVPATKEKQRVIVKMPNGFEYKEMEVAQATVLKGSGPIKFNHKNTHSSLAFVEQTHQGLVA